MWYVSSNRDVSRYDDPDRFDVRRNPEHQAFGAGGRHFCLGTALARLELRIMLEETLARYPEMERAGPTTFVESGFINQLKTLPVRLGPDSPTRGRARHRQSDQGDCGRRGLLVGADHVHDGVDQRQVRERLREVAQVPARLRVDLLGVEPERAGVAEQALAQRPRAVAARRSRTAPRRARTSR